MALRPILRWPDPRLSAPCAPVGGITDEVRVLASDMLETMYAAPGRGLAAPQVGVLSRLFVMDVTWKEGTPTPEVLFDPEVLWLSPDTATGPEGCLSIPGVTADVTRPVALRLRWRDLHGAVREDLLEGPRAICAQHEIDHLDGRVTLDRLDAPARAAVEAEYAALSP